MRAEKLQSETKRRALPAAALLAAAGMSLGACGFHLRTEVPLPPELARVQISGADRDLVARLADELSARGAEVGSSPDSTESAKLRITTDMRRAALSTGADGRATAYSLTYAVQYQLKIPGETARAEKSFSLRRAFDYDAGRHLQAEAEARFLEDDLRREAAARVLSQLARE